MKVPMFAPSRVPRPVLGLALAGVFGLMLVAPRPVAAQETGTITRKERSLGAEAFRRLLKNKVAVVSSIFIIVLLFVALFAGFFAPFDYAEQDLLQNNAVPEWMLFLLPEGAENYARITEDYPLGADHLGRDILSRTIYGARVSLTVAIVGSAVSLMVGII